MERITLATLAPLPCWVAWQTELRRPDDKKPTKVPYNPGTAHKAKADDPRTWGTRQAAEDRAMGLPKPFGLGGVGLELAGLADGRSVGGIDLDSCRNPATGEIAPWAAAIVDRVDSYTEVSPSGSGVKVFFLFATADAIRLRTALGLNTKGEPKWSALWARRSEGDHPPAVEMHLGARYFAVTDLILPGCTDELREVPTADLLHVIEVDGPGFVKLAQVGPVSDDEADAAIAAQQAPRQRNGSGQDKSRSVQAFRVGAAARRKGADFEAMCAAIRDDPDTADWYAEKGEANGGRELRRIWDKADPFDGQLILAGSAPLVSARQFIGRKHTLHGIGPEPLRTLHHQNATFYTWERCRYAETPPEAMRAALYGFLDTALTFNDREELVPFNPSKNKVANVMEATAAEAQLSHATRPPAWLDGRDGPDPAELIACRNGLLRLSDRRLFGHTPAFYTLNALPFDYQPQPPRPDRWIEFLHGIWPGDNEAVNALQEFFGLALTADTSFQKAFLIVGPKRSGKGTIARVLTELLGTANVCSPTLSSISTNFGLSPLIGRRLAIISDARLSGKADQAIIAERLLAITGEDGQTIDRKFRDPWTGKLDVRFLVLTNELPRLNDASGALASRFVTLTMARSFYGQEDRGMLGKLLPELPGILGWAIAGWERLTKRGHFIVPKSSAAAVEELENLGSPIGAFLRQWCEVEQGNAVACDTLYQAWCAWCRENGRERPGTVQTFGRDLGAAIPGLKVTNPRQDGGKRHRHYEGVALNSDRVERIGTRTGALHLQLSEPPDYHPDDPGPSPAY